MKKRWIFIVTSGLCWPGLALAQSTLAELEAQLLQAEDLVSELEDSFRQTDLTLAEPLAQLASQYTARGRYGDAHRILDRATQIVRINEGLYTRSQLPYVQQKIENFAAAGDWESARQQMQHISWLYRKKSRVADARLIEDLLHLSKMHLRGVNEDLRDTQSYHFRRAISANWMALTIGEAIYGREDVRLVPIIYELLHQHHLQKVAVDRGGTLSYQLRQVFPGSDWVRERNEMRNYFYYTGRRLLNQIAAIYTNPEQRDEEAIAMARLYTADWQVLFGRDTEALESYQQAFNGLKILQPETVDSFFANPRVLPIPDFHASIAEATNSSAVAQEDNSAQLPASSETLSFTEWGRAFPYVRPPYQQAEYDSLNLNRALFSFNLSGVSDVPVWINTRNAQKFSVAMDTRILDSEIESEDDNDTLTQRVEWLSFRPRLVDGLPQDSEAVLEYRALPEL